MKRLRLPLGLAAALLILALALPFLINADQFRPLLVSQLQSATGRPVQLGKLSLSLFPLSLQAANLIIQDLAAIEAVEVRVPPLPLLQGKLEIDSLVLTRPVVDYKPQKSAQPSPPLAFRSIQIVDGTLRASGHEFTHIDASLTPTSGQIAWKNGTLPVSIVFAATNNQGVYTFSQLDAKMGDVTAAFSGQVNINTSTLNGALKIKPSPLAGLPIQSAYKTSGTITADVKVSGPFQQPAFTGAVQIANLQLSGPKLPQPLHASALGLALTPTRIFASPFSLSIGSTQLQATFQLNNLKTIDATLSTTNANLTELLALAPAAGLSASGSATLLLRATGSLDNPQLSGSAQLANAEFRLPVLLPPLKVDAAQIKFEGSSANISNAAFHIGTSNWTGTGRLTSFANPHLAVSLHADQLSNIEMQSWFPKANPETKPIAISGDVTVAKMRLNDLTLDNLKSNLTFRDKHLTLDPMSASVYGGRLSGSATVNLKPEPAVFTLRTHLDKVESELLLAAATPLRKVVTGPLTAETQLEFSPKPNEDFARTLNGTLHLQLAQGKLLPLNMIGELNSLVRFLKPVPAGASNTPFLGMKGTFQINNGVAETQDLRLDLDRASALITGSLNLSSQSLDLRMLTTLNKQFSEEVGGSRIGGFLTAALASPQGELLIPSLIKGTFAKPVFSPDAATVGKLKLSQPQNIQQGVQGVLDLLKGRKKQP
jgi:AsmA protein